MNATTNQMSLGRARIAEANAQFPHKIGDHLLGWIVSAVCGLIITGIASVPWSLLFLPAGQAHPTPGDAIASPIASAFTGDEPTKEASNKDSALIRQQGDSWVFDIEGQLFVQDPKVSYEYKLYTKLPAKMQPGDGLNYRIEFAEKTKESVLIKACKNLAGAKFIVAVELANCDEVTNKTLKELSKNNNLLDISLCDCNGFDDEGLAYLAKLKHLRQLGLYGANGIKGDGIRTVLKGCKSLDAVGIDRIRLEPAFVEQLHKDFHGQVKIHHRLITCECSK